MSDVLRQAATRAADVLRTIRDADSEFGVTDPDVDEAIAQIETALNAAEEEASKPKPRPVNQWGFKKGEPLRIIGGKRKGMVGTYAGASNARDIYVIANGQKFAVSVAYIERAQ